MTTPSTTNNVPAQGQKSVLVTGGSSGIGLENVRHFASQGHRVAMLDVSSSGAEVAAEVAAEFPQSTVTFKKCDVSSWEDQAAAFKQVYDDHGGRLDVVMANAGISEQGVTTAIDLSEEEPSKPRTKSLEVNLVGVVYSVKLAAHYMNKNPPSEGAVSRGSIICTASNAGLYPFPTAPLYAASKAGVIGLVRSMGVLLESSKIQINGLAPAVLGQEEANKDDTKETNIAPDKALFNNMIMTPMSTLIRGVAQFIEDPSLTGAIAEIHGEKVTIRPHHDYVDEDTKKNLDTFWSLGYA
ncbi:NAD(P)-binding protein [Thozetella sp. PMI_491]|nr:NAD(P)-binding protein [Thozetella sp. PMI_491]